MPWIERMRIIKELKIVDYVIEFNDDDDSSRLAIKTVRQTWPDAQIIFANGGDRTAVNIPEMDFADSNLIFKFGVGGQSKLNSSSWILDEWKAPKTQRAWGYYRVLHEHDNTVKVKELTVDPGQSLSMQRHSNRGEHWIVAEGIATVYTINRKSDVDLLGEFGKWQHIHIVRNEWHQLRNETSEPLKLVEVQYGPNCQEEDIERK